MALERLQTREGYALTNVIKSFQKTEPVYAHVMQKYFLPILIALIFSCQNGHKQTAEIRNGKITSAQKAAQPTLNDSFADSIEVGRKGFDKVEIAWYSTAAGDYAITRFYAKRQNSWILRNEFKLHEDQYLNPLPEVSDLNGDGFNDVTYDSFRAANGANEVRTLFIYDSKNDSLVYIKNSENYPNMQYNKELHCIDAFLVSGCAATVFLKLEKDSLREFASVERCDSLIVSTCDRKGREKVILAKKADRDDFTRYKNYRPLRAYDE
jgi:hypothetical protein